jgi:hypothetical protein
MHKRPNIAQAMETISYQGSTNNLGKELKDFFENILNNYKTPKDIRNSNLEKVFNKIVKDNTRLKVSLSFFSNDGIDNSPYVLLPELKGDHVMHRGEGAGLLSNDSLTDLVKGIAKFKGESWISFKDSKVNGVYSECETRIVIQSKFILNNGLTAGELTAVTLHELGHVFTYFEYFDRQNTCNEVLASLSLNFSKASTPEEKKSLINLATDTLGIIDFNADRYKNEKEITKIALALIRGTTRERMKSTSNTFFYDSTSCEQLADQFCTRHGYGRELGSALDRCGFIFTNQSKIIRDLYYYKSASSFAFSLIVLTGGILLGNPFLIFVYSFVGLSEFLLSKTSFRSSSYDSDIVRIKRIKEDVINIIKNKKVNDKDIPELLKQISYLDKLIEIIPKDNSLLTTISNFLTNSFSQANELKLNRYLEELAASDLFIAVARLHHIKN